LKEIAVIAGVTSGTGLSAAKRFVSEGVYIFLTGFFQKVPTKEQTMKVL
jgi:NADP-dependent 3-hydroxy acid dehydrogenase YdfG